MPEFATLSCPSCGAKLQISNDLERFACAHCGNEHIVKRDGGVISLSPVVEQLKGVRTGVDKTASELAIRRLKEEIQDIRSDMPESNGDGCLSTLGYGFLYLGTCVGLFFGIGVIASFFSWDKEYSWGQFFGCLSSIVILAIGGFLMSADNREKQKEQEPYDNAIHQKLEEIAHHEGIVNSK